jgi:hypothetical protein
MAVPEPRSIRRKRAYSAVVLCPKNRAKPAEIHNYIIDAH